MAFQQPGGPNVPFYSGAQPPPAFTGGGIGGAMTGGLNPLQRFGTAAPSGGGFSYGAASKAGGAPFGADPLSGGMGGGGGGGFAYGMASK